MKRLSLAILGLLVANSCNSGVRPNPDTDGISDFRDMAVQLPYVKDVTLPEQIFEGVPFTVTTKLSAALHPEVLREQNHAAGTSKPVFGAGGQLTGVEIYVWMGTNADTDEYGPIVDTYTYHVPGIPAGDYVMWIQSADSPERGGLDGRFELTPNPGPLPAEHVKELEIPFTVLPAQP